MEIKVLTDSKDVRRQRLCFGIGGWPVYIQASIGITPTLRREDDRIMFVSYEVESSFEC